MTIDIWDPATDLTCKSCGHDGGVKHANTLHKLHVEIAELKQKQRYNDRMSGDDIAFRSIAKYIAIGLTTLLLGVVLVCNMDNILYGYKPPISKPIAEVKKDVFDKCIEQERSLVSDCVEAMNAVELHQQGPGE